MQRNRMVVRRPPRQAGSPGWRRRPRLERLEDRTLLAITLNGVPEWHEEGPGPIVGSNFAAGMEDPVNPLIGAIESVAVATDDADLLYIGSVTGGVWKTTNATDVAPNWTPLTDQLPSLSIGAVALSPFDDNVVYAGTGRFSRVRSPESNSPGVGDRAPLTGILRSTDAGATWSQHGQVEFVAQSVRSIVPGALLQTGQVVLAATVVGGFSQTFGSAPSGGLYRSVDFGETWTLVSGTGGLPVGDVSDVIIDPANPQRYFAAIAGNFDANSDGVDNDAIPWNNKGVYVSNDHGATWVRATSGMNADFRRAATRIELSAADYPALGTRSMYAALVADGGLKTLYRTTDGGGDWAGWLYDLTDSDREGSGLHFLSLLADRDDPRAVWISGNNTSPAGGGSVGVILRGADGPGGYSFQRMILENAGGSAPHEDSREMVYDADGHLLEVDDGGIYRLRDPNQTSRRWESVIGDLRISELYSIAYDHLSDTIIGGTQDNGTAERRTAGDLAWDHVHGGDGNYTAVDLRDPNARLHYSSSQNLGKFEYKVYDALNDVSDVVGIDLAVNNTAPGLVLTKKDPADRYKFVYDASINQVTPYVLNAVNPDRMLIGTKYLYESLDRGETVTSLGGVVNLNGDGQDNDNDGQADAADPEQDEFVAADWSNDTLDNDGDGIADGQDTDGDGKIDVPDPDEPALGRIMALVYGGYNGVVPLEFLAIVGTTSGLWMATGADGQGLLPYPTKVAAYPGAGVRAVVTDPLDARYIYVADKSGSIWHSRDFGGHWYDLTGNLGDLATDLRSLELKVFRDDAGVARERVLFVGGEGGVYRRRSAEFNQPRAWTRFGEGMPNVTVTDLHYDSTDDILLAGTFGRGVWSVPELSRYAAQPSVLNLVGEVSPLNDELRLVLNDYNPLILDVFFNNPGNVPTLSVEFAALEGIVFLGKAGDDHLIADFTYGETIPWGGLIFGGDEGTDRLTVLGSAAADRFTFRNQNIETLSARSFSHSAESVLIDARGGDDTIQVEGILSQWSLTAEGGEGNDDFLVTLEEEDLGRLNGSLTLRGGGGGRDVAEFHDQQDAYSGGDPLDVDYRFTADGLVRSLVPEIQFSDLDALNVWAGAGRNEFYVDATPPLSAELLPLCRDSAGPGLSVRAFLCLSAGDGDDALQLAPNARNASTLQRDVWFYGEDGDDEFILHDEDNIFARAFRLEHRSMQVNNLDAWFDAVESVALFAGTNFDTIAVAQTGAALTVDAGDGADTVRIGDGVLGGNIAHPVSITGGDDAEDDHLQIEDQLSPTADGYVITDASFQASSMAAPVLYTGFEELVLSASPQDNVIDVNSTAPGAPVIVHGGAGNDTFRVNAPPSSRVTLVGGAPGESPGDSLVLSGTGNSDGSYGPSAGTPGDGIIMIDGQIIEFEGLEPVIVHGFRAFRLITPNADDDLIIDSPQLGRHRISGSSGAVTFESLAFFDVARLVVDMAANNGAAGEDRIVYLGGDLGKSGVGALDVITVPGSAVLNIEGGATSVTAANGLRELRVNQLGTVVHVLGSLRLESLFIDAGAQVVLDAAGNHVLHVARLEIEGGSNPLGTLDIQDNGLIVDYASNEPSPWSMHRAQILRARNEYPPALWTGHGITSGAAAAQPALLEVALDEALDFFGSAGGVFYGTSIAPGEEALLIRTINIVGIPGDTDSDGDVDITDLNNVRNNFGAMGQPMLGDTTPFDGDVDIEDLNAVRNHFGMGAPSPIATTLVADVLFGRLGRRDLELAVARYGVVESFYQTGKPRRQLLAR